MLKFDKNATDAELTSALTGVIKFDLDEGLYAVKASAQFFGDSTSTMEAGFRLQSTTGETTPLVGDAS